MLARPMVREELREELGHLIDNEEIPDWYLGVPSNEQKTIAFDLGKTVSRTEELNKEINKKVSQHKENVIKEKGDPKTKSEIDFDELDKLIEEKFIVAKSRE